MKREQQAGRIRRAASPGTTTTMAAMLAMALGCSAVGAGCGDDGGDDGGGASTGSGATGAGGQVGGGGSGAAGAGGTGGTVEPGDCIPAEGPGAQGTDRWLDGAYEAVVTMNDPASCERVYTLSTNAPLRDNLPVNPRTFGELADWPVVRTGHDMFDALYALALEEVRENSVDSIQDGAFNGGTPIPCPPGGCFETGRLWKYVWTRDTAYAVLLGLGALDPTRARNSLEFKLSERRGGGDLQIVQDTGTGGSYPISTDRVVWAMGAWELFKYLDGAERDAFLDLAYEAVANTAEHDRLVVFDPVDGLYRGEQSFLDWREQSYPAWVATDTVQIGMSKTLSTNVGHYHLLWVAAQLAAEKGLSAESAQYQGWADGLAAAIRSGFDLPDLGMLSTMSTTFLDPAPTRRFDLLGSALAVRFGVATGADASSIIEGYPHLPKGPAVHWPQQKDIPIYHNRGIWPFVTALWLTAAKQTQHAAVLHHGVASLMRGAALNLSNMENFEAATGAAWLDDGAASGPVVNSQRQLWSVAGYVSMVHDVIFGLEADQTGIRFAPTLPLATRNGLFSGAEQIALSNLPYKGRWISVVLHLGESSQQMTGALEVDAVQLNGTAVGTGFVTVDQLADRNVFEVFLAPASNSSDEITLLSEADVAEYRNLFGPYTPSITSIGIASDRIQIGISSQGESAADIALHVYRDGQRVAADLPGSTTSWTDPASADHASRTYCYSVEATFVSSGTASQHARPVCYWGPSYNRIQTVAASSFVSNAGTYVVQYDHGHYQGWGDPADTLTVYNLTPNHSGPHYLQLLAGNGAGPFSTGITCGVKLVEVWEGNNLVGSGYAMMPQLDTWDDWRDSSFVPVQLSAASSYDIVIREDAQAINMSEREHFASYGGTGGVDGRFNRVNIAQLKLLAIDPP